MLSLVYLIIAWNAPSVWGEIKAFSGPLPATSNYVQFSRGYLVDPGYIDLSNIIFTADKNEPSKAENIYTNDYGEDGGFFQNDDEDYDDEGFDDEEETDDEINDTTAYDTSSPTASPTMAATAANTEAAISTNMNSGMDGEPEDSTTHTGTNQEQQSSNDNETDTSFDAIETKINATTTVITINGTNVTEESYEIVETEPDVDTDVGPYVDTNIDVGEDGDANTEDNWSSNSTTNNPTDVDTGSDKNIEHNDADGDVVEVTNTADNGDEGGAEAEGSYTVPNEAKDEDEDKDDDDYDIIPSEEDEDETNDDENDDDYDPSQDEDDDVDDDGEEDKDIDGYYESEDGDDADEWNLRKLASGGGETVVDVVFFHEPTDCAKTKEGCDWTDLGIGQRNKDGNTHWCCSEDALKDSMCESDQQGRLILDRELFDGIHRPILVPGTGDWIGNVEDSKLFTNEGTGQYTLVMANCNDYGRNLIVNGEFVWMNRGGFLPGDLFSELHFLTFITLCYSGFLFWYLRSMMTFKDSIIGIQKWILGAIVLVLIEMFFKVTDYMIWNNSGHRSDFAMYVWIIVGVLKGAISRCVLVMVSLGWGVIRDTLGDGMKNIIILGVLYSVLAFAKDVAAIIFVEDVEILSIETEREIYDIFTILTFMVAVIDVLFYMWILDGLNATMQYLENMNQTMKLKRFLRLRLILVFSIFFGFVWSVFGIVDATMDTALLSEGQEWIIRAAWYVNYGCVLVAIALLWKPDPRAKQYAYVMELPSVGDDMVLDTCVSNEDDGVNVSYSDYRDDGKFTIGNAVSS